MSVGFKHIIGTVMVPAATVAMTLMALPAAAEEPEFLEAETEDNPIEAPFAEPIVVPRDPLIPAPDPNVDPIDPAVDPLDPGTEPTDPSEPTDPETPTDPTEPADPDEPEIIDRPVVGPPVPTDPDQPAVDPADPGSEPATPSQPGIVTYSEASTTAPVRRATPLTATAVPALEYYTAYSPYAPYTATGTLESETLELLAPAAPGDEEAPELAEIGVTSESIPWIGSGTASVIEGRDAAVKQQGREYKYMIQVESETPVDKQKLADAFNDLLTGVDGYSLERVDDETADITVVFATPLMVQQLCDPDSDPVTDPKPDEPESRGCITADRKVVFNLRDWAFGDQKTREAVAELADAERLTKVQEYRDRMVVERMTQRLEAE